MSAENLKREFVPFESELLEKSVPEVFLNQAKRHGSKIAVVDPEYSMTYRELVESAVNISHRLKSIRMQGVFRVALLFDQSALYVSSLLGVLGAGGAYVPLDARRDADWNREVFEETGCDALLCDEHYSEFARSISPRQPIIVTAIQGESVDGCFAAVEADALACIYYTSGTTGRAKGVCDTHRNLLHNVLRYTNTLQISSSDCLSVFQAPIFSGTQSTLFSALLNGATVACYDAHRFGLSGLSAWLNAQAVTMFHGVPAVFRSLAKADTFYSQVRLIRLEGDRASAQDIEVYHSHFPDHCVFVNGLGATECGLIRQFFVSKDTPKISGNLPLGYPVPDTEVVILNDSGNLLPANQIGEIAVRSKFLALGYLNQAALSAQKFTVGADGERTYLTGDMGSLDESGCLRLIGRKDLQLKVNGQTVSLEEVESVLGRVPGIRSVVATTGTDENITYLAAFLLPDTEYDRPTMDLLQDQMRELLPQHMRPTRIGWIDTIPLSVDGKVDRKALPILPTGRPDLEIDYVAPRNQEERRLVSIWEDVLHLSPVGIRDEFLLLGGSSISAVELIDRVESELHVELSVSELFNDFTVESMLILIASGYSYD